MANPSSCLPPGFRFHPTDEELILHYLRNQATASPCPVSIIAEVDIYKFDPWELPAKAAFGEREWYFFSPRDRKYPNGARPNRAAVTGYWKATGTDKPILATSGNQNIGVKKALVFYKGRPPKGVKSNWIMHEYRLADSNTTTTTHNIRFKESMRLDDWVLCRIYKKSNHLPMAVDQEQEQEGEREQEDPTIEDVLAFLPNVTNQQTLKLPRSSSISDFLDAANHSLLAHLVFENSSNSIGSTELSTVLNYNNPSEGSINGYYSLQKLPKTEACASRICPLEQQELKCPRPMLNPQASFLPSTKLHESTNMFDTPNYQFANQQFFDEQLLINPQLEFQ